MGIAIDMKCCKKCRICEKSCAAGAIHIGDKDYIIKESCTLCGLCIDACPFGCIELKKMQKEEADSNTYQNIWVFIETAAGEINPVSLELLGIGKELAQTRNCKLAALLLNRNGSDLANEPLYYGADQVYLCTDEKLSDYSEGALIDIICSLIQNFKPETLLFGATSLGRSIAPSVAARVQTGLTADCTVLETDTETGCLLQTRPAFGGNIMATIICPNTRPQMATVRGGIMKALPRDTTRRGKIIPVPYRKKADNNANAITVLETILEENKDSITNADILVVAGKGIGSKKNMKLVREFAAVIGASVGVSRPLVDAGWGEYQEQVGQTGSIVAPKLLISLGVSGAIQHIAGISGAEKIIAVNTDSNAPIFNVSHYKAVGDCIEIIETYLSQKIQSVK